MTTQGRKSLNIRFRVGISQENSTRSLCLIRESYIYKVLIVHATTVIVQGCGQTLGLGLGQSKDIVVVFY